MSAHKATNFQGQDHINYTPWCYVFNLICPLQIDLLIGPHEMFLFQTGKVYDFKK